MREFVRAMFRGQMRSSTEIAEALGISRGAVAHRIKRGLPLDQPRRFYAGGRPVVKLVELRGRVMPMREAAEILGISEDTVRTRAHYGRTLDAPLGSRRLLRNQETKCIDPRLPFERDDKCKELVRDHPNGMQLESVGEVLGCTRERVRQIERKALAKLKRIGVTKRELERMREDATELVTIRDARQCKRSVSKGRRAA